MPQIIKLDNFTNDETTENKYNKFEKIYFKKSMKLEDLNKNGHVKIEYDVNTIKQNLLKDLNCPPPQPCSINKDIMDMLDNAIENKNSVSILLLRNRFQIIRLVVIRFLTIYELLWFQRKSFINESPQMIVNITEFRINRARYIW